MNYKEALKKAREIDNNLEIGAFITNQKAKVVSWLHGDGSRFEVVFARVQKLDKEFFAIFTEHHGLFVYHTDDVDWIKEGYRPETTYCNKDIYK